MQGNGRAFYGEHFLYFKQDILEHLFQIMNGMDGFRYLIKQIEILVGQQYLLIGRCHRLSPDSIHKPPACR
jgi:hypothetical protein